LIACRGWQEARPAWIHPVPDSSLAYSAKPSAADDDFGTLSKRETVA
jgi:hypothetical protein